MKVLLTKPATDSSNPWYFPSGLGYIARAVMDAGHEVSIMDAEAEGWNLAQHCQMITQTNYDVLGISALINKYNYVGKLAENSRRSHPHAKIVLGGNITGPIWKLLLKKYPIDVCVIGEGEITVQELLSAFEKEKKLQEIYGIAFIRNEKPFQTPLRDPIVNLDDIPFPPYDIFPMEKYLSTPGKLANRGVVSRDLSMITSRGCPYQCTFCYRPLWEKVRHRSCENVMAELSYLVDNYDVNGIVFNDELTLRNKSHVRKLCDEIEKVGILWGCVGRVNIVDQDLLKRMYETGCRWITYGIESGSQTILEEMRKKVKVDQAKNAVLWTQKANIATNPTFILGFPSENRQTAMETVKFIREANLHPDSFFFATPYPGTELYKEAVKMGRIPGDLEEYLTYLDGKDAHSLLVNLTQMSDQELIALRDEVLEKVALSTWEHAWNLFLKSMQLIKEEGWKAFISKAVFWLKKSYTFN
jgi:radical SAM superfamily enzyme YgiQ (UPF0313 family)